MHFKEIVLSDFRFFDFWPFIVFFFLEKIIKNGPKKSKNGHKMAKNQKFKNLIGHSKDNYPKITMSKN